MNNFLRTLLETSQKRPFSGETVNVQNVIILDGQPNARFILRTAISAAARHVRIHEMSTTAAALQYLDRVTPALIFVDSHAPQGGGEEFVRTMRKRLVDAMPAVVFMGVVGDDLTTESFRKFGATEVYLKGSRLAELMALCARLLSTPAVTVL